MKKVIIACFLVIMMLMVPISSVGKTVNIKSVNNILSNNDETPAIYITEKEFSTLNHYINGNFEGDEKEQADTILNDIISYDEEYKQYLVNISKLSDTLDLYGYYQPIPDDLLANVQTKNQLLDLINDYWDITNYPFGDFIKKIIDIIKPRLGWIYDLFAKGGELFVNGVNLAIDFIEMIQNLDFAIIFATIINLIVTIPVLYFSETIKLLFNLDFDGFISELREFTGVFTDELNNLVDFIEAVVQPLGEAFDDIKVYVSQVGDFVDWVRGNPPYTEPPWEQEIKVSGYATSLLGEPYVGVDITCRGVTTVTDSAGKFEFIVEPSDNSADSVPKNSYYGLHSCVITVSKDDKVLKQTPKLLSYVFSGGEISWPFIIIKAKSKDMSLSTVFAERFNNILLQVHSFFPIFFKNINKYNV